MGFFDKLKDGLTKTRDNLYSAVDNIVHGKAKIDDEMYEELEETLITADLGMTSTMEIIDQLRERVADEHVRDPLEVKDLLKDIMKEALISDSESTKILSLDKPAVILVIGVNGVGKTTTIGKIANYLKIEGKTPLLCAADTFRAAAIDQLELWSEKVGVPIVKSHEGADPASVVYDGIAEARTINADVLLVDTAGRLHNKKNLMQELEKMNRIIEREFPEAYHETLLVLDASTGQNAILQAKAFNEVTKITGLILTKLDGTAKGGVIYPLQKECEIPVQWIGVGEGVNDLRPFDAEEFVSAIFGPDSEAAEGEEESEEPELKE